MGAERLRILPIRLLRCLGIEAADKTVRLSFPAAAAGAVRLRILPIRLFRWHGIEIADETISAALPVGAIFVGSTGNNVARMVGNIGYLKCRKDKAA